MLAKHPLVGRRRCKIVFRVGTSIDAPFSAQAVACSSMKAAFCVSKEKTTALDSDLAHESELCHAIDETTYLEMGFFRGTRTVGKWTGKGAEDLLT